MKHLREQVGYVIAGSPRCILEAATARGFKHVPATVLDRCLRRLGVKTTLNMQQKAHRIIACFKEEWGWTPVDVARGMQHAMGGARAPPQRTAPREDAEGPEVPEHVLDILHAMDEAVAAEMASDAAIPSAAEPAVADPNLPGYGHVDSSFLDLLLNPEGPARV